jgi:hypothetical protein
MEPNNHAQTCNALDSSKFRAFYNISILHEFCILLVVCVTSEKNSLGSLGSDDPICIVRNNVVAFF